ncbi:ATP-binding protein [Streptomyces sp. V4-01]|uniref:ATP-binding protein n=1 Tax=Actinacidiphila polyblastidii TaxID=3110430 RepID=A0ABU7PCE0_9ACTN|nr:ATP-binding protein [Streptomyces sp. V4-01]
MACTAGLREDDRRSGLRQSRSSVMPHPPPPARAADDDGVPVSAAAARERVRQVLRAAGVTPDSAPVAFADALLVVSELVTNALVHAGGVTAFIVRAYPGALEMRVGDPSDDMPLIREPGRPSAPGGFGLPVVNRLCVSVDVQRVVPVGKTVTAVLRLPTPAPR